jgi:hypothetical protein
MWRRSGRACHSEAAMSSPRILNLRLLVAFLVLMVAGCGGDPVGDELQEYWKQTAVPACRVREEALSQFKALGEKSGPRPSNPVAFIREEILGRLTRATRMLSARHPKYAILVQANGLLEDNARRMEQAVEEVIKSLARGSKSDTEKELETVTSLNATYLEIMSDITLLGVQHGLDLKI